MVDAGMRPAASNSLFDQVYVKTARAEARLRGQRQSISTKVMCPLTYAGPIGLELSLTMLLHNDSIYISITSIMHTIYRINILVFRKEFNLQWSRQQRMCDYIAVTPDHLLWPFTREMYPR